MTEYITIILLSILLGLIMLCKPNKAMFVSFAPACIVIAIALSMILLPEPTFKAAERGLAVWWEVVLPALLPFFITAELLMGLGVVHFIGVLMEPLMRPIFNVPGTGAFVLAMGIASGYPLGAALSARLKIDNLATKTEAERLMCFCNTSDPLFMTGAVAVGMFKRTDIAKIIISTHYLSALTIGLFMRFWRRNHSNTAPNKARESGSALRRAFNSMRQTQQQSGKSLGELMGDAVKRALDTLLLILGFIVLFSVIFEIITLAGITEYLSLVITKIIPESILPKSLHPSIVSGIFEITIATSLASTANAHLIAKVAVCSGIIAWSGLSVHAQVAAVIQPAGLSIWPYTATRLCQGVLAALYTVSLMHLQRYKWSLPTFEPTHSQPYWLHTLGTATKSCIAWLAVIIVISLSYIVFHIIKDFLCKYAEF